MLNFRDKLIYTVFLHKILHVTTVYLPNVIKVGYLKNTFLKMSDSFTSPLPPYSDTPHPQAKMLNVFFNWI